MKLTARWTTLLAAALVLASTSGCSALYPFDGNPEDLRDAAPAQCGNDICEPGENCESCPDDCVVCGCNGDGVCEPGENVSSCGSDCYCGNNTCDSGEDCTSCPGDCDSCVCGNGVCDSGENCESCSGDCGICACGNGTCDPGEDCTSCPADCDSCWCGNGTCDLTEDCHRCPGDCGTCDCMPDGACSLQEDQWYCPQDCWCGNGTCDLGEDCANCQDDCGPCGCNGDGVCEPTEDEDFCSEDCNCGNGTCEPNENCANCPADCGTCGCAPNGVCEPNETESTCSGDCWCGDGTCDPAEDCSGCPVDCGTCPVCGDTVVQFGEQCDDGNTAPGDGCDGNCQFEDVLFYDPLDNFDAGWMVACSWSTGVPDHSLDPHYCVQGHCAGTNLYGDYQPGHDWGTCILDSPVYHFPINPNPGWGLYLSFWGWIGMDAGDCARVMYSIDGGVNWDILYFFPPHENPSHVGGSDCFPGSFRWENYYAKVLGMWTASVDVVLQFEIYTMGVSGTAPGFYVDELRLVSMPY